MTPSQTISFFVPGIPKAQPRVKAFARGGRAGVYDPGTANEWKATVRAAALKAFEGIPADGSAYRVELAFFFPRPKNHFGRKKGVEYLKANAPLFHVTKPDWDNLAKAVTDAFSPPGLHPICWLDDSQIVTSKVEKCYSGVSINRLPGVGIYIRVEE